MPFGDFYFLSPAKCGSLSISHPLSASLYPSLSRWNLRRLTTWSLGAPYPLPLIPIRPLLHIARGLGYPQRGFTGGLHFPGIWRERRVTKSPDPKTLYQQNSTWPAKFFPGLGKIFISDFRSFPYFFFLFNIYIYPYVYSVKGILPL